MTDREYNTLKKREIERICKAHFRVNLPVTDLIAPDVSTDDNSFTTVFKSGNTIYALCETETPVTLGDVRSIVKQMGMEAETYFAPHNDEDYFMRCARKSFLSVFPGREIVNTEDLLYYQTLAPYSPALVQIRRVNGQIRRFSTQGNSWQKTLDFTYFRPQVQLQ